MKHNCKPKYQLASADHEALVKSSMELVCNPKLKGRVAAAIKEVFTQGKALEELTIGLVSCLRK